MKTRLFTLATAFLLSASLSLVQAQSPGAKPKDDDLDALLEKVDQKDKPKTAPKVKDQAQSKPVAPSDKPKTAGEVSGKDKELDDLLGKIGESKDEPTPEKKQPNMPGAPGENDKPMPGGGGEDQKKDQSKKKEENLSDQQKELDEHLKELAGKREQKKNQKGDGKKREDQGPLGDLVKQMREVEERLGKPDTGDETRQKQTEIVKKMDTLIEQMKMARNQQQAMRMLRQGQRPNQPGQNPNGDLAQGPPATKPAKPDMKSVVALDKNAWGHLPPDLRQEMENVFKEDLLPARADLIKRYYLSVSKKSLAREE
jgi:hypothetical protein